MQSVMTLLSLLSHQLSLLESLSESFLASSALLTQRLPYRIAQRLQRGVAVLDPQDILRNPEQHTLNDSQLQLLRLHLLCDDVLDTFQLLQALVLQKYTQERDKQRQQRQSKETAASASQSSEDHYQSCDEAFIAKRVNSEGLERGPTPLPLSLPPHRLSPAPPHPLLSGAEDCSSSPCLPHELWFQALLNKYQTEFGGLQHDRHDSDMILGLLLDGPSSAAPRDSTGSDNSTGSGDSEGTVEMIQSRGSSVELRSSHSVRSCRPPLGIFCVYLACCLVGEIDCTAREWAALMQVRPAPCPVCLPSLTLPSSPSLQLLHIAGIHFPSRSAALGHPLLLTHQHWSERLFRSLRDLKAFEFSSLEGISPHDYTRVMTAYH
jgi:hypothetical protein